MATHRIIILKDCHKVTHGDIVRFRKGNSALMRIDRSEDIFSLGIRIYGQALCGDDHAAWASDCVKASAADLSWWSATKVDRFIRSQEA